VTSPSSLLSSTKKTDCHDITEKVYTESLCVLLNRGINYNLIILLYMSMFAKLFVGRLAFCDIESFAANTKTNVGPTCITLVHLSGIICHVR
jgi:hypothetical protein